MVIEIDGSSHDEKEIYDGIREEYLESFGLKVFKITDFDVKNNLGIVMKDLEHFIINNYSNHPVKN